ncbi:hypothetical protein [Mycetohabitans endofungorum]|uniref:hypothetical protein n=1 Tax=Mycetohabitans endofungorum TaxID=417203 RepID=UPI002B05AD3E|nr:hypothetical protein [Mycetohabitans endofungorum]
MISSHPYAQPVLNRPKDLELVKNAGPAHGVANGVGIGIRGLEIVQTIQSTDNHVRLIAGKATVARLYLDPTAIASNARVTGELAWRRDGGGMAYLPAINRVKLTPATRPSLQEQRFDAALSLNFVLPPEAVKAGRLELAVQRIYVPGANDVPIATPVQLSVEFRKAPLLRVRAIGLRYRSLSRPGSFATPDATHFNFLRSYLLRAYPVAVLDWSQLVVDADLLNPPFGENASDLANAQLTALRAREISSGIDPRTHYYGLVDDDHGTCFMRGSAVYDKAARTFGLIASGPTGVPNGNLAWDTDASYADWYGAHELGHTFQRRHPGFPRETQPRDPDEPGFPYPDGLITTIPDNRFVGFDVGDPALAIPMRALPGKDYHDVMTYANNQWLSAYTYEAIHERLMDEEVRLAREGV